MNITGKWTGYYQYGYGYMLPLFGEKTELVIELNQDNDEITGVTSESGAFSVPFEATIKGFIEGDFISFVKTYPHYPFFNENGNLEMLKDKGKLEIEHQGYIDSKNDSLYGQWSIYQLVGEKFGDVLEFQAQGIWMLHKK